MIGDTTQGQTARGIGDPQQLDLFPSDPKQRAVAADAETSDLHLSRIGHDLRTALNAIMGFSEIMTHRLHGPLGHPKYDEYVSHVRCSGEALLAVTDEVLALASYRTATGGNGLSLPIA